MSKQLLLGDEAIAQAALDAGLSSFALRRQRQTGRLLLSLQR